MWSCKEIATACAVAPTAATRKRELFEARLADVLRGLRTLDIFSRKSRPCDLAESVASLLDVGGKLAEFDRGRLKARIRQLLEEVEQQTAPRGG
jgi:hypothetical protein